MNTIAAPAGVHNQLVLSAQVVSLGALRSTPAGIPAVDLTLKHESVSQDNGQVRRLHFEIRAKGIGKITRQLQGLSAEVTYVFSGYLGALHSGRGTVFHVTAVQAPDICSI